MKTPAVILAIFLLILSSSCYAASITDVCSGDSLCVWGPVLQSNLTDLGMDVQVQTIARGGATTWLFNGEVGQYAGWNGQETWPEGVHDYAQDAADAQPDLITFMIGTNDAVREQSYAWPCFQHCLQEIYDKWANIPHVIVATIPPQLYYYSGNNQWIDADYNPFIKAQAAARGFRVLDINDLIQQEPNWQAFYTLDGIHLGGNNNGVTGNEWLAAQWSNAVLQEIPEPGALWLLSSAAAGFALRRFRRRAATA
jgi:lysophospholipase L1-like esterase